MTNDIVKLVSADSALTRGNALSRRSVTDTVIAYINELTAQGEFDSGKDAVARVAIALAEQIDAGDPPHAMPQFAKELRSYLDLLRPEIVEESADAWVDDIAASNTA